MIFALLHATLGWLLASLACVVLRRRSAAARCWAWRLGLLKGPLALLLAVPVAIVRPFPASSNPALYGAASLRSLPLSEREGKVRERSAALGEALSPPVRPSGTAVPAPGGPGPVDPGPVDPGPVDPKPVDPLPIVYGLGVATVIAGRLRAGRKVHAGMPRVEGVLRPRVVVPGGLAPEATAMALAHETAHVRRRDPLWSLVADLVCAALWFAPPVWLCARGLRAEAEAACDAAALEATAASRKAYARLLLGFAGPAPANALGGPARRLARRIHMLERKPQPLSRSFAAGLLALGFLALLPWRAVAVGTAPAQEGPEKGRLRGFGAGLPATRLPLHVAVGLMLEEPGVRQRIGWTAAQDAEMKAGHTRWEAVVNAHRKEMVRLQATGRLKEFWAWDARERPAMFARAGKAAGPMPWTPEQERALKAMALARFGSALWLDPQVADRLQLTPAQKAAVRKENSAISRAAIPLDAQDLAKRPVRKKSRAVEARLKALYAAYATAPPHRRAALYTRIENVERPYRPVYESRNPVEYKARNDRRLAQSWRMRGEADRRLAAKLSPEQRARLDRLKQGAGAWPVGDSRANDKKVSLSGSWLQKRGARITMSDDVLINGQKPQDMPPANGKGTRVETVSLADGSAWKVYAEGDRAPYQYRIERVSASRKPGAKPPAFLDYRSGKATEALRQALVKQRTNIPPRGTPQPWTEESIRRSLHLRGGEKLEFRPDPERPGEEVAERADREGRTTRYRIRRRKTADGAYAYEVDEAVYTVPVAKPKP